MSKLFFRHTDKYQTIKFNAFDKKFNCLRESYHGPYYFIQFDVDNKILVPCNPIGRTGIIGRGKLARWGPNHAAGYNFEITKPNSKH